MNLTKKRFCGIMYSYYGKGVSNRKERAEIWKALMK